MKYRNVAFQFYLISIIHSMQAEKRKWVWRLNGDILNKLTHKFGIFRKSINSSLIRPEAGNVNLIYWRRLILSCPTKQSVSLLYFLLHSHFLLYTTDKLTFENKITDSWLGRFLILFALTNKITFICGIYHKIAFICLRLYVVYWR